MQNFRNKKIAFGVACAILMVLPARSELPGATQKFKEVSGVIALAGYWQNATVERFSLEYEGGFLSRTPMERVQIDDRWHILLTDVKGLSAEQAESVSILQGLGPIIHPVFVKYVRKTIQSKNPGLPQLYLCLEASKEKPFKIGARLTLKSVTLTDTGGMRWKLEADQMQVSELKN